MAAALTVAGRVNYRVGPYIRVPVVDAFRTFCINPGSEGSALLNGVRNLTYLTFVDQVSGPRNSARVSR
jgi:hypothetical protein